MRIYEVMVASSSTKPYQPTIAAIAAILGTEAALLKVDVLKRDMGSVTVEVQTAVRSDLDKIRALNDVLSLKVRT
jgi:hypothetical protein